MPARPFNIRMDRKTVAAMVRLFCRKKHLGATLCPECDRLLNYAWNRLDHCPFGPGKTTCAKCPVHCYRPAERDAMRLVMRTAGPLMFPRHPWLSLWHLWQGAKGPPKKWPVGRRGGEEPL